MKNLFDLSGKTALITGGGGLLGPKHAEAIVEYGGKVILEIGMRIEQRRRQNKSEIVRHITTWMLLIKNP